MTFYTYIRFLGDYCDVDVEYEVIEGDDSVGLKEDYEFTVTCADEQGNEVDITDDLTETEVWEVVEAIQRDMKDSYGQP